jgi:hypothetical protein
VIGFFVLYGRFYLIPESVGRLLDGEEVAGGFGNGLKITQKLLTLFAILEMGMIGDHFSGTNQFWQLGLEFCAG